MTNTADDSASYTLTIKKKNGYSSRETGRIKNSGQYAVVIAALAGELGDDVSALRLATPEASK